MKTQIKIELAGGWVLKHRSDAKMPIDVLKEELGKFTDSEIKGATLVSLTLSVDGEKVTRKEIDQRISRIFAEKYPGDDVNNIINVTCEEGGFSESGAAKTAAASSEDKTESSEKKSEGAADLDKIRHDLLSSILGGDSSQSEEPKPIGKVMAFGSDDTVQKVRAEISGLVGASEFKALADEVVKIAPEIKSRNTYEVFTGQSYLFSIGDGCGLSTYLQLFADLISAAGIRKFFPKCPVLEEKIPPKKENVDSFNDVKRLLSNGDSKAMRILCVDISEWMNKTDTEDFKQFLREVENHTDGFIVVFRVPFVEKDVVERIRYSLSDLLYVRAVTFPPLTIEELKICAAAELDKYAFKVDDTAWEYFGKRISEEKSDGKFYGLNTVKKVVRELIYKKQLKTAESGENGSLITDKDMQTLCYSPDDGAISGFEMLNQLVGCEQIAEKIKEIIAQIDLSLRTQGEKPCVHMRFVGNPGTGKTTVARIVGKILKEKGVLRIGNFYEYAARDLCGRYIGETAPKTAGICRDAYGSVLFIDEAYSLYRGEGNERDYGKEVIDTLIAEMENHRSDFVVIMAGYTDDMEKLMNANAGLKSRMPYTVEFPNFTREQLYGIFVSMVKSKFSHDDKILEAAHCFFNDLSDELLSSKEFSNARFVRNLFERTWAKAAMRSQLDSKAEIILTKDDFDRASSEKEFSFKKSKNSRIGF